MRLIESQIESGIRAAIRSSLQAASAEVPELADVRIFGFWIGPERDGDSTDADGNRVEIKASPNSSEGYSPASGLMPQRSVSVDVDCYTQPDDDGDKRICRALYTAVRSVFETAPFAADLGAGVVFGGLLITSGGAADYGESGQLCGFTVQLAVSVTA